MGRFFFGYAHTGVLAISAALRIRYWGFWKSFQSIDAELWKRSLSVVYSAILTSENKIVCKNGREDRFISPTSSRLHVQILSSPNEAFHEGCTSYKSTSLMVSYLQQLYRSENKYIEYITMDMKRMKVKKIIPVTNKIPSDHATMRYNFNNNAMKYAQSISQTSPVLYTWPSHNWSGGAAGHADVVIKAPGNSIGNPIRMSRDQIMDMYVFLRRKHNFVYSYI